MQRRFLLLFWGLALGCVMAQDAAVVEEPGPSRIPDPAGPFRIETLAQEALDSVVVIHQQGRTAGAGATGTGFIISEDGLIATNWHVINDRRRIAVELRTGKTYEATEVHAWDRRLDLALIRIDPDEALPALELGDSDSLVQGQAVIALGNPRGLKFSVVEGVVSGFREDVGEGPFPYIQLAIPVEEGNSGGPVIDREGMVRGVVTMKSMVTRNLGFAVPSNALRILLEKPNSMPMERWATIGRLDPRRWTSVMGSKWSQRAGRILVEGVGDGFGGRALCLAREEVPGEVYEVEVEVKLNDETGAAGLVFASDGGDIHYGFYPSGGRLRLTRFNGPDVYSWEILEQLEADSYVPGEWNRIKVRVEPAFITCFVNGTEVVVNGDSALRSGQVGLCKFRTTEAEFRGFRVGPALEESMVDPALEASLHEAIEDFLKSDGEMREDLMANLMSEPRAAGASLESMRAALQLRMERLERLTRDARARMVGAELAALLDQPEPEVPLFQAGLRIAKLDQPDLDTEIYEEMLDTMSREILEGLQGEAGVADRIAAVRRFMFEENGFHASRLDYYHESNSYLNEVLDDREGIPITLSVVFMELLQRSGVAGVHGIGLPDHFVVGVETGEGEVTIVDVYEGGVELTREDATLMVLEMTGREPGPELFEPVSKRQVVARMLRNLVELQKQKGDPARALPYLELALAVDPEDSFARFDRALLRYQEGDRAGAKKDLRWLLQSETPGLNLNRLRAFYERL